MIRSDRIRSLRSRSRCHAVPAGAWAIAIVVGVAGCSDGDDAGSMLPPSGNAPPIASATATPTTVPTGDAHATLVTLDGSGSVDPDGDPLTFDWTVTGGRFESGTTASDPIATVSFPGAAPYPVSLVVSDGRGGTDAADLVVGIRTANNPPAAQIVANPLGIPVNDNFQTVVTLDGRGSSDPDGDPLAYAWTVPGGRFETGGPNDPLVEVTFPGAAPYLVELVVDDGNGETDRAEVLIDLL